MSQYKQGVVGNYVSVDSKVHTLSAVQTFWKWVEIWQSDRQFWDTV